MGILNVVTDLTGESGITPRIVRVRSNDSFATITALNYLRAAQSQGYVFTPSDIVAMTYGANVDTSQFFTLTMSGADITLVPSSSETVLPVIANHIAVFTDTAGTLGDDAATAINGGNLQAGLSGTAGTLASFPATAATGSLKITAVANTGDTLVTISNREHGQATVYSIGDVGQATGSLLASRVAADPSSNLIGIDIVVGQAALAAGGEVVMMASSGTKRFRIRSMNFNAGGTNFSGGGGDRLGLVTDGTTNYSVPTAAALQSLANVAWGDTRLPFPVASMGTSTAEGAPLVFKYSGGTTDYTAGSLVISALLERVA